MHDAKYLGGFTLALFLLLKGAYSKALILLNLHDSVAEVLKNSKGSPLLKSVVIPFDEIVIRKGIQSLNQLANYSP